MGRVNKINTICLNNLFIFACDEKKLCFIEIVLYNIICI